MIFWKNWPYWSKVVIAVIIFFSVTLGFAFLKGRGFLPRTSIESLASTPVEAARWEKKPKVVYFWATWCTVCKTYSYLLNTNLKFLNDKSVFLSVVEDEESLELQNYLKENKIDYPVYSANYQLLRDWKIGAYPTTVFLNAEGKVLFSDTGLINPFSFWLRSFLTSLY
ncbi:TlpA family protein disulfide reductase [Leptospira idonii]|uniref:TlpA family protein disulfide reductase n=1 Tax=Leptospira idonii TaxID=1193500 RepID=A0A4V3JYC6_9LEPT|nr:TlpA disulfide reductase family protein [Leptospira idonii]TGN20566.1 TlpA family protein disulfide reductase [Leptospira idonii]